MTDVHEEGSFVYLDGTPAIWVEWSGKRISLITGVPSDTVASIIICYVRDFKIDRLFDVRCDMLFCVMLHYYTLEGTTSRIILSCWYTNYSIT